MGFRGKLGGGWRLGGIVSIVSGPPFTANLGSFNNSENGANFPADRPDLNPGIKPCSLSTGNPAAWFNPTGVFTLPPAGEYGKAGRNIMCGPPLKDFDCNVSKQVRLRERVGLEFRADLFNLFNHPNLNVPVNTAAVGTSGGNGDQIFLCRDACRNAIASPNSGRIFQTVTTSPRIQFRLTMT